MVFLNCASFAPKFAGVSSVLARNLSQVPEAESLA